MAPQRLPWGCLRPPQPLTKPYVVVDELGATFFVYTHTRLETREPFSANLRNFRLLRTDPNNSNTHTSFGAWSPGPVNARARRADYRVAQLLAQIPCVRLYIQIYRGLVRLSLVHPRTRIQPQRPLAVGLPRPSPSPLPTRKSFPSDPQPNEGFSAEYQPPGPPSGKTFAGSGA